MTDDMPTLDTIDEALDYARSDVHRTIGAMLDRLHYMDEDEAKPDDVERLDSEARRAYGAAESYMHAIDDMRVFAEPRQRGVRLAARVDVESYENSKWRYVGPVPEGTVIIGKQPKLRVYAGSDGWIAQVVTYDEVFHHERVERGASSPILRQAIANATLLLGDQWRAVLVVAEEAVFADVEAYAPVVDGEVVDAD